MRMNKDKQCCIYAVLYHISHWGRRNRSWCITCISGRLHTPNFDLSLISTASSFEYSGARLTLCATCQLNLYQTDNVCPENVIAVHSFASEGQWLGSAQLPPNPTLIRTTTRRPPMIGRYKTIGHFMCAGVHGSHSQA